MNSITKRWLRSSLLTTFLLVTTALSLYIYTSYTSYYGAVEQAMLSRISSMEGQLKITTGQSTRQTSQKRSQLLRRMVEQFDEKEKFEFMLMDEQGQVIAASSGALVQYDQPPQDFTQAFESTMGAGKAVYTSPAGERIIAITVLTPYTAEDIAGLRMVTSMTLVDEMLVQRTFLALGLGAAVLLVSAWSGVFFIRSIVKPLQEVEQAAEAIAKGDLSVRLPQSERQDEISRLCQTINQMAQDLSKTERLQNEFISSVSHELRTPLTSIRGWVETVAQIRDPDNESYRKGLSIIGRETDRLYDMVEELLSFSRLQSGVKLECEALDLVAELTDAVLFMEPRIHAEGLRLSYEEPELPLPIWADARRLRQVFVNVLDNAVKYSPPGGTITLDLLQDGDSVYVLVKDQGRGIAPEDLEHVKMKFFKGKGAVRGSGIGLAIVDEVMTALDGSVDIASQQGKGTTVTLRLPLHHTGLWEQMANNELQQP